MTTKRIHVGHRMLDLVAAHLDQISPEVIPVSQLSKWAESSAKVSMVIDENPYDAPLGEMKKMEGDVTNQIINDPGARDLALKLDQRLWVLKRLPVHCQPTVVDSSNATP